MMSPNKMVVTLLMVSVQIASAAEGVVVEKVGFFSNLLNSSKEVVNGCAGTIYANKEVVAALVVASGVSVAAYYNWDRVKQAYNNAVVSVKANQEAIVKTLKVGAVAVSVIGAVTLAAYKIHEYCFAAVEEVASNVEVAENATTTDEVASNDAAKEEVVPAVVILPAVAAEVVASDVEGAGLEDSFVASTPVVAESSDRFDSNLVANLV